jgi:hypothetical protein
VGGQGEFVQEIDGLIDAVSTFLVMVSSCSYETSLYTVQWYFLYKQILLEGQLTETLRLDVLLT